MGFAYCRVLWYPQYAGVVAARCGHGTAAAWGAIYVGREALAAPHGPAWCLRAANLMLVRSVAEVVHRSCLAACAMGLRCCPMGYEAYTPLARVRTIAHPRRVAQQERAASSPHSSSLCNSGHFFEFRRFFYVFGHFHALLTQIGVKRGIF